MAKQKKKRNKAYKGQDAKNAPAQVIKVEAVNRGKVSQWWFEMKPFLRPFLPIIGVVLLIILIVSGIISLLV